MSANLTRRVTRVDANAKDGTHGLVEAEQLLTSGRHLIFTLWSESSDVT